MQVRLTCYKDEVYSALVRVTQGFMRDVIPILAAPCTPGSIPPQWDSRQRYDATKGYDAALAGMLRAIGLPDVVPAPKPTTEQPPAAPAQGAGQAASQSVGSLGRDIGAVVGGIVRGTGAEAHLPGHHEPGIPTERFPQGLKSLGFVGRVINGIEVIIPPMCDVPAGEFVMGSNPGPGIVASKDDGPQHNVDLPAFQIGRFPVTVAEYACFVRAGQNAPRSNDYDGKSVTWQAQLQRLDYPVVCITWQEAYDYTGWLRYVTGNKAWRLPSEAEWEKAARWDPTTRQTHVYPWGDIFEQWRCNTKGSGKGTTTPVGTYPAGASPCGAQDMVGNVYQWTSSITKPYPYKPDDGREAGSTTANRQIRGNTWNANAEYAYPARRADVSPDSLYNCFSLRLALTPSP